VVAIGTTVVRALEHAGRGGKLIAGAGMATQRIGAATQLRIVDAIVTGTHEPGSSHYDLMRAFAAAPLLHRLSAALEEHGYRTHEFGDSVLLMRQPARAATCKDGDADDADERGFIDALSAS
jgi:S-adenosylmethionine:tRNA ribosyltransferase-isomerase